MYYESNLGQSLLKPLYQSAQEKLPETQLLRLVGVSQYTNKFERISSLEPSITYGHLLFSTALNPRLIQQLILFPTGHDDGPDALQGAVAQLKKQIDSGLIGMPVQVGNGPNLHRRF